jgi:ubiquinone/menaquinone biosynthesis C-methylase UbiE
MFIAARLAPTEQEHAQEIDAMLQAPEGAHLVDLGCGSGALGAHLQRQRPDIRVTNVVNEPALIAYMRQRDRCCIDASFEDTGLPAACAEAAVFSESLGHGDLFTALKEASRILKEGGVLLVKDFSPATPGLREVQMPAWGYRVWAPEVVLQYAHSAGLLLDFVVHPTAHMQHWRDIIGAEAAAKDSASLYPPEKLPLRAIVYRFTKGAADACA